MFSSMNSVRYKILLIAVIALIGFIINLSFNFFVTKENASRLQDVRDIYFPVLERIDANLVRLDKIKETLNTAASAGEIDMLKSADNFAGSIRSTFAEMKQLDPSISGGIDQLGGLFESYYTNASKLTKGMIEGSLEMGQIKQTADKMTKALNSFQDTLIAFRGAGYERFTDTLHQANEASETALTSGIIITLLVMLVVGAVSFFISTMIARNILNVVDSLQEMAKGEGDLTKRIATKSSDEIGALVDSFNQFVEKLQHIIKEVTGSTIQLATAAEEMSMVMETSSNNVQKQKLEVEQVATAMNEMTATVQEVSLNAEQAANTTSEADHKAQEGGRVVNNTVGSINTLASEVESASTVIHDLEENSESIGSVLEVIRGIAEQTNLLALNAAIEAARAGDQGRGFAVVADEVRGLASRTQQSTQEIQEMIERLQTGAQNAVSVMESGRNQAQISVEQAAEAGEALSIITNAMSNITSMNIQIAEAAKQQSEVAEEINQNIVNIGTISEESANGIVELSQSSNILAELSANLQLMVGQFKV